MISAAKDRKKWMVSLVKEIGQIALDLKNGVLCFQDEACKSHWREAEVEMLALGVYVDQLQKKKRILPTFLYSSIEKTAVNKKMDAVRSVFDKMNLARQNAIKFGVDDLLAVSVQNQTAIMEQFKGLGNTFLGNSSF